MRTLLLFLMVFGANHALADIRPTVESLVVDPNITAKMAQQQMTQTCKFDVVPSTAPDAVFSIDKSKGTVVHLPTQLMFTRCLYGLSGNDCESGSARFNTWSMAMDVADKASFAGFDDWRLPNANELIAVTEMACFNPALNTKAFPNRFVVDTLDFQVSIWSSTPSMVPNTLFPKSKALNPASGLIEANFRRNNWGNISIYPYLLVRDVQPGDF